MNSALPPDDSYSDDALDGSPITDSPESGPAAASQPNGLGPYLAKPVESPTRSPVARFSGRELKTARTSWYLPAFLFVVTCLSTFFAGAMSWEPHQILGALEFQEPATVAMLARQTILRFAGQGFVYMLCVITILFAHEMGHYIATRIYRVPSTLPFFIPFPIAPVGTMGAVIAMKGQQANRKEIFDIGIAGPLAGLVFAIPIMWFGVAQMEPGVAGTGSYQYDLPLMVRWMYAVLHPDAPAVTAVYASQVNAMFMAGWVGLLITGLNMLPVSQLDGGHVTYTLFGSYSRWIAIVFVLVAIGYMAYTKTFIWALMLVLIFLIGLFHPPTSDDTVKLGTGRVVLGLFSLLIPVLCFPPRGLMPI